MKSIVTFLLVLIMANVAVAQTAQPVSSLNELANGKEYKFYYGYWDNDYSDYIFIDSNYNEPFTTLSINKDATELTVKNIQPKEDNNGKMSYETLNQSVSRVEIKDDYLIYINTLSGDNEIKFDSLHFETYAGDMCLRNDMIKTLVIIQTPEFTNDIK